MKPFSKMQAIGQGKPVMTRDGRKVPILYEVPADIPYPVVGVIEGGESITTWTSDGKYRRYQDDNPDDLFMASTKKEGWINLIKTSAVKTFPSTVFSTKEDADKAMQVFAYKYPRVACVKITWEE